MDDGDAEASGFGQERVQDVARAVGRGKEFTAGLLVKRDADLAEELDGVVDGEAAKDAANDRPAAAPEVGVGHAGVGDVAARATADEDLRAEPARAVDERDGQPRMQTLGEDRRREAGRAGPDDYDITRTWSVDGQGSSLSRYARASCTGTLEIAPHALQRTVTVDGSSPCPMISVRWFPHFGQTGGVVG
jgi:hypothetical protein